MQILDYVISARGEIVRGGSARLQVAGRGIRGAIGGVCKVPLLVLRLTGRHEAVQGGLRVLGGEATAERSISSAGGRSLGSRLRVIGDGGRGGGCRGHVTRVDGNLTLVRVTRGTIRA